MQKEFWFRKGTAEDADQAESIYEEARKLLGRDGIDQWQHDGPSRETFLEDTAQGNAYVLVCDGQIAAVAAVLDGPDSTYRVIEGGAWHAEEPYTVIHRVAASPAWRGAGAAGILFAAITEEKKGRPYFRIDTHEENLRMQAFLKKQGFVRCGKIYLENGDPRIGFDRLPGMERKEDSLRFEKTQEGIRILWES